MIADKLSNEKLNMIVAELFIIGRKPNLSLVFYHLILFCFTKNYETKFNTLFYYEDFNQTRASKNRI